MKKILFALITLALVSCNSEKMEKPTTTLALEVEFMDVVPGEKIIIQEQNGLTMEYDAKPGSNKDTLYFEATHSPAILTLKTKNIDGVVEEVDQQVMRY